MLHLHNSPACEALSAWVEATGEEVPMPAETEGSSGGVQPGVSVTGNRGRVCTCCSCCCWKGNGGVCSCWRCACWASSLWSWGSVWFAPGPAGGLPWAPVALWLGDKAAYIWLVEDVGVRDATAAVDGDAAELHSLGRLLSGREPLGLETDAARQGSCPHQLPNPHWAGGPAGEEACPQG